MQKSKEHIIGPWNEKRKLGLCLHFHPKILRYECINPYSYVQEIGAADLEAFHPSRSKALGPRESHEEGSVQREETSQHKVKSPRRQLTKTEKLALEEEQRKEKERNQKEREKKIRQREKKRKDLRKMTSKGQPVMKTRLEDLLGKVRKIMKDWSSFAMNCHSLIKMFEIPGVYIPIQKNENYQECAFQLSH